MIELPEALVLARQLAQNTVGKTVAYVLPPLKEHKFCWFNGDPTQYEAKIKNTAISSTSAFGMNAELVFENGYHLCVNDGVNIRLQSDEKPPKNYQLMIVFTDHTALSFSVMMYGGIILHDGNYDNIYYLKSKNSISPFDDAFSEHYIKGLRSASRA